MLIFHIIKHINTHCVQKISFTSIRVLYLLLYFKMVEMKMNTKKKMSITPEEHFKKMCKTEVMK